MKQSELYEQIEAYLQNALPPDELRAFEQRMADDEGLRAEVDLHRQLQQDFDAGRLQLRANLRAIMQEPLPPETGAPPPAGVRWWRWLGMLAFVLIAALGIWRWQTQAPVAPVTLPPAAPPVSPPVSSPPSGIDTPQTNRPMAMADPARFQPNPGMEAFVNSSMRSESIEVKWRRPVNGVRLMPDKNGGVRLPFSGSLYWPDGYQPAGFVLSFFDNRNAREALLQIPVNVEKDAASSLAFDLQQRLNFAPGLYYFTLEEVEKGEVLYAGKFFIGR